MKISPFWLLAAFHAVYMPIGLYLIFRERPPEFWSRYYDWVLKRESIESDSDIDTIQEALDTAEKRDTKIFSAAIIALSCSTALMLLFSLEAIRYFYSLFIDILEPVTAMMAIALYALHRVRTMVPEVYKKCREIARGRAVQAQH